jgi:Brp/Blh family beta-carotene 15,15'-monooxygenase
MLLALRPYRVFLASCLVFSAGVLALGNAHIGLVAALCLLILVAGLPHGAFDLYIMAHRYQGRFFALAIGGYLGLVALTVGIWFLLPLFFLGSFLIYSAYHFGDSDWPEASLGQKLAWGTSIVSLPCLISSNEVALLFEVITGTTGLGQFTANLGMLAIPATLWLGLSWLTRRQTKTSDDHAELPDEAIIGLLLACYATVCALGGPLAAFACYFACLHSPFHLDHWQRRLSQQSNYGIYALSALVLGCVGAIAYWMPIGHISSAQTLSDLAMQLDSSVLRYTFVALAALTVPHMTLLMLAKARD